jgi:hypothetical protein
MLVMQLYNLDNKQTNGFLVERRPKCPRDLEHGQETSTNFGWKDIASAEGFFASGREIIGEGVRTKSPIRVAEGIYGSLSQQPFWLFLFL